MVAHANDIVDSPRMKMLEVRTRRAPYRSTSHPTTGETPDAARPPKLAAPAMSVRLHPSSSARGNMKTARVRLAAELRATWVVAAENSTTHP